MIIGHQKQICTHVDGKKEKKKKKKEAFLMRYADFYV